VKYCPNCGTGVEPGTGSCESCGTDLAAVRTAVASSSTEPVAMGPGAAVLSVADLTPRQLRKEIRWGVFQGILLVAVIIFLVYLAIFLVFAIAVETSVSGVGG
jgi:uncharacterized membrane protein YvbJ